MHKLSCFVVLLLHASSIIKTAFASNCSNNSTGNGLMYADYKDECLLGGHESFLLNYKRKEVVDTRNTTEMFKCQLCNPRLYLDCYNVDPDPKKPIGECDCIHAHSKGYILVYDKSESECRGYLNSVCGRSMSCHTGLKCHLGTCICEAASNCTGIPTPRLAAEYVMSDAFLPAKLQILYFVLIFPLLACKVV